MAWFTFTDASNEIFVFKLTDGDAVSHARALLDGSETGDPRIAGTVVKSEADYNIGWSYHLDPASIFFFELSTEVGDSTMRYIEDHLPEVGGALLPGSVWTGWSSSLLEELNAKSGSAHGDFLVGSLGSDILFARAGNDRVIALSGNDHLVCGAGRDWGFGGNGDDKLSGGGGGDFLFGGSGKDLLAGDAGNDRLAGGNDSDTFLFAPGSGADVICRFRDESGPQDDIIDLRPYGFGAKSEIGKVVCGNDLILDLGGGSMVRIAGYLSDHTTAQINNDILI